MEVQLGDPSQVGHGDLIATGHAGQVDCRHDGIAHRRGPATDAGHLNRDGERDAGSVGIAIYGDPGIGACRRKGRGRARQGEQDGVHGQAGGKGTDQGIGDGFVASDSGRQHQGGNGDVVAVALRGNDGRAEARWNIGIVVQNSDDDSTGRDGAVAAAAGGEGDGDRRIARVGIIGGGDGDRLGTAPVRDGEDLFRSEGHGVAGGGDRGCHGHVRGGGGVEHHRIGRRFALRYGEGRGGKGHPGRGRLCGQSEAGIGDTRC